MAEREGFEPSVEFPLHTLSKRAPSTTRTSLHSMETCCTLDLVTLKVYHVLNIREWRVSENSLIDELDHAVGGG